MKTSVKWTPICIASLVIGALLGCEAKKEPATTVEPTPVYPTGASAMESNEPTISVNAPTDWEPKAICPRRRSIRPAMS